MRKQEAADRIVFWPNTILVKPAEPVTKFDEKLTQLAIDLLMVLKNVDGLGLSACQIGNRQAVCAISVEDKEEILVNPTVVSTGEEFEKAAEGCLSLPSVYVKVARPTTAVVRYQDLDEKWHTREFEGLEARVVQHEVDNLNGKTILHTLSKLKRDSVTGKMKKLHKHIDRAEKEMPGAKMRVLRAPSAGIR